MGWVWTSLMLGLLATGAYGTSRYGFGQPRGITRGLAAVVLGWTWLTIGMEGLGSSGHLTREALFLWSLAGFAIGLTCRLIGRRPESNPDFKPAEPCSWSEVVATGLVLWAVATPGLISLFFPVKVVSDGPIYHLYFAARWWKAHRLELVPIPFGESAAPYFPAVGDLWYTWLMVALGEDRLAKVGQVPFYAVAGVTTFALARRLGASRASSVVASSWFLTATPFLIFSFEPNVDTILVAGYLMAVYFFTRHALGDDGPRALALGALAAGAALGTKATGIVFVPPLLGLAVLSAVVRGRGLRGKLAGVMLVGLPPLVVDGFWYVRNFRLTGNPLYPLHVTAFGKVWLAGWYGRDVMRMSRYYIPFDDWRSFGDQFLAVFDPRLVPLWLVSIAGAWALSRSKRSREDAGVWALSALCVANIALYWSAIPYRTQQRFMFHAIGLAAVPLARTLDLARWVRVLGVVLLAIHLVTPPVWPWPGDESPWDLTSKVPNGTIRPIIVLPIDLAGLRAVATSPGGVEGLASRFVIGLGSFLTAWACWRLAGGVSARRVGTAVAACLALAAVSSFLLYPWGVDRRFLFLPGFREYVRGWVELDLRSSASGARVAYAGTDLAYYLMGVGLRNDVRYVNIDGHPGWLLHDYHREASRDAPATWDLPRPGWDRIHPDYGGWVANLRGRGIQLLVVTRANMEEGPHNIAEPSGFPVEYVWAQSHPETFQPLYGEAEGDPNFRLYRVRPPG